APAAASRAAASAGAAPLRRLVLVADALRRRAAVAFQLRFNPVPRRPVAIRTLPPIAELCQPLHRGLVFVEIEPSDQHLDRVAAARGLVLSLRRRRRRRLPPGRA